MDDDERYQQRVGWRPVDDEEGDHALLLLWCAQLATGLALVMAMLTSWT